jgi:3-oxoacyl-[acyl-carrier-protein] synthase II
VNRVAVTGLAFVSPFGDDREDLWQALCRGSARTVEYDPDPRYDGLACTAALLPAPVAAGPCGDRFTSLVVGLARRALADAGFPQSPPGTGLAIGSLWAETDVLGMPRRQPLPLLPSLGAALNLTGPVAGASVACCAGNTAIAWAVDQIRFGDAPVMLAGGLDLVGPLASGAYTYLDTLATTVPRPFDENRDGFLLAEGGAMFVLEPLDAARQAGRRVLGEIVGTGSAHDAFHATLPSPEGRGLIRAMRMALEDGRLNPSQVGYVNAHAPGTIANDPGEAAAIVAVFGPHGVPVSSTKGVLGHAQGGANALEAIACLMALDRQAIPPTRHLETPDSAWPLDLVMGDERPASFDYALSAASSMGGAVSVLVFGRGEPWA